MNTMVERTEEDGLADTKHLLAFLWKQALDRHAEFSRHGGVVGSPEEGDVYGFLVEEQIDMVVLGGALERRLRDADGLPPLSAEAILGAYRMGFIHASDMDSFCEIVSEFEEARRDQRRNPQTNQKESA